MKNIKTREEEIEDADTKYYTDNNFNRGTFKDGAKWADNNVTQEVNYVIKCLQAAVLRENGTEAVREFARGVVQEMTRLTQERLAEK